MADPSKKPSGKVSKLTRPTRETASTSVVSTWSVPSEHTKSGKDNRAQQLDAWWTIGLSGKKTLVSKRNNIGLSSKRSTLNMSSLTIGTKHYNRQSWWPYTKTKVLSATVKVRETNKAGAGPWASSSLSFKAPGSPKIESMTLNNSNGRVSFRITSGAGSNAYERVRTAYKIRIHRSTTNKTEIGIVHHNSSTDFTSSIDVASWQAFGVGDYIRIVLEAWNEGWAGNSKHVERKLTLAYPAKATIGSINCAGTTDNDKVTVYAELGNQKNHPVTLARLEALINTEYKRSSDIPGDASWEQVGATDDGKLKAFATTVGQLRPEQGNRTWLRVVTVNMYEQPYSTISAYKSVSKLEVALPTAVDDSVELDEPVPSEDGKSADVTVKWNEDTPNTGTELTWANDEDAWNSTQPPAPFEFTWKSGTGPEGFTGHADVHVMGLTEGVSTYIKARRYYEDQNGDRTWTGYSNMVEVTPVTAPNTVTLSMPSAVPRGDDIEAVWTYDTDSTQTEWQLLEVRGSTPNMNRDRVLASGNDARGSVVFPSDRLSSDTRYVYVSMSTGGKAVQSEPVKVSIVDPPTCSVSAGTLTVKPLVVTVESNVEGSVVLIVTADGIGGDGFGPDQMAGDTVWSGLIQSNEWTASNEVYQTEIEVPSIESLFYDTGRYHVSARVIDPTTGLASDISEASFEVDYSHKAPELTTASAYLADVKVTPYDVTDVENVRTIGCTIALDAPSGFADTDVMDVYRVGRSGVQMVAEGLPPDAVVVDPYAPFGGDGLAYRVVARTEDGDRAWADYPYELHTQGPTDHLWMRIDYADGYIECERSVAPSTSWNKDFSLFTGIDGSMTGTWNSGVKMTSSSQAAFVRTYEEVQQMAMEELAWYVGPCYVRVSDGSAYEADVQVTGRSTSVRSAGVTYSLAMTMLDPSGAFVGSVVPS